MSEYDLGTARGKIEIDAGGATKGINEAEAAQRGLGKSSGSTSAALAVTGGALLGVGAAAVGGFAIAINAAANFEAGLSKIEAVSGATESQMEAVRKKALKLGADTVFSAGEAASAMEELVKAGLSVDDTLNGAADAAVALAAAGEIDLAQAAEIAAAAMNNFNLKASDMPKVADLIAGSANASAISVEEFGQSMKQAGAVASLVGMGFDDMALAITAMGNAGIKGSDAGTSLKTFLSNLQPGTLKQTKLFKELGLITEDGGNKFFTAAGKLKSLGEISDVLQGATKGMTDQQKTFNLEMLFGSDAIRAAAIVTKEGSKGFADLGVAMGKVTAADVAATKMDNLKGTIEALKGSFETLLIVIGTPFLAIVRKIVEHITSWVNWIVSLNPEIIKWASFAGLAAGALVGLAGALILAVTGVQKLMQTIKLLQLGALFTNPVFLVIAAIALLAVGLFLLYQKSEAFRNIVNDLVTKLKTFLAPAIQAVTAFVETFIAAFGRMWTSISKGQGIIDSIGIFFDTVFGGGGKISSVIQGFVDYLSAQWQKIADFTREIWPQVQEAIGHVVEVIKVILRVWINTVMALWRAWGDDLLRIAKTMFNYIKDSIDNAIRFIQNLIRTVLAIINGDWGKAWEGIKGMASAVWAQILNVIRTAINLAKSILGGVLSTIAQMWSGAWSGIRDKVGEMLNAVIDFLVALPGRILAALVSVPGMLIQMGKDLIQGFINGITEKAKDIAGAITSPLKGAINLGKSILGIGSPSRVFFEFGVNTIQGYINGLKDREQTMRQALTSMFQGAVSGVNTILSGLGSLDANHQARLGITAAEDELKRLKADQATTTEEIAAAEEALNNARRDAAVVTLDEERDILNARQSLARAEQDLVDSQREGILTADEYRLKQIEIMLAQKELDNLIANSTKVIGPEVEARTDALNKLREHQKTVTTDLALAEKAVVDAKFAAIAAEARLIDSGAQILGLGRESHEMFRLLAERIGLNKTEVDKLSNSYSLLAGSIQAAIDAAARQAKSAAIAIKPVAAAAASAGGTQTRTASVAANSMSAASVGGGMIGQFNQTINGVLPGDVERETGRALRTMATEWEVN